MPPLIFVIGYGSPALSVLRDLAREFGSTVAVLSPNSGISEHVLRDAKVVFLYTHEVPPLLSKVIDRCSVVIGASEATSHLCKGPSHVIERAIQYFRYGGVENLRYLIQYLLWVLGMYPREPPEPRPVPWHGIWHPELGTFTDLKQYLEQYPYSTRPLVGILFYRSRWLYGDVAPVVELIRALEDEGLGAVPVFTPGVHRLGVLGEPSVADSVRTFFMVNGRSVVDLVLSFLSFYLDCEDVFRSLGVPVLKVIKESYRSVEEWLASEQGISSLTQVWEVVIPEVDGVVEPIFLCGAREVDGCKVYEVFPPHVKYVARRVRRWIELRRKPPSERRIAIVLNNPPCKQIEATIGVAMGLDVPESLVRFLHRLKELGYYLGDGELPRSGKELIKLILERRATSEFRWTSPDDIVKRGGCVGFVDLDTYMGWFSELPERVREVMIKEWGDPRDILSGEVDRVFAGAVYEGKFIVPGIRFGNVVIIPQPKFGCVGSACDGRVCKVLHNPNVPPPHQWLAVYRWITRVFRADVVIHFGTHGTLEFRPGKGVGLSPMCWPEITIDDVPFLYIYIVTNPMEGVIAKRRGYAVIVDHMYPPMMFTDSALQELDELLEQYERARRLNDASRASELYRELVSRIRKLGIPLKIDLPEDEVISVLHRYLELVKSTQVEKGLHVFGRAPTNSDELAETVVVVMRYDTSNWPSIRRAVAEYLGLSYDELLKKPNEYCEVLGTTNRRVLELLDRIAVEVLKKLLEVGASSSNLDWSTLEAILHEVCSKYLKR